MAAYIEPSKKDKLRIARHGLLMWQTIMQAIKDDREYLGDTGKTLKQYKEQTYFKLKAERGIRFKSHCAGCTIYSAGDGDCHARCRLVRQCSLFLDYQSNTDLSELLDVARSIYEEHEIWIGEIQHEDR